MRRREFILATTLAALGARGAHAQQHIARIGILSNGARATSTPAIMLFQRLAEAGYGEGKNAAIEFRSSDGNLELVTQQARELLGLKLEIIIAIGPIAPVRALIAEKATLPVVFLAIDYDPVDSGIVASYNRPGGNYTGAYIAQPALAVKRLELARELAPQAKRVLVVYDEFSRQQFTAVSAAAAKLGVGIETVEFKGSTYDYAAAFRQGRRAGAQALVGLMSPAFFRDRMKIAEAAAKERLFAIGGANEFTEAGYLMSYGSPFAKVVERATELAVRILKGAKPADLPVEQVNVFEFAVNMKTAKALGVKIPNSILVRADKVIE
jgi:putative ABC transport system substrate-binding protein